MTRNQLVSIIFNHLEAASEVQLFIMTDSILIKVFSKEGHYPVFKLHDMDNEIKSHYTEGADWVGGWNIYPQDGCLCGSGYDPELSESVSAYSTLTYTRDSFNASEE